MTTTATITVLYFGLARDCAGSSSEPVEIPGEITVGQLWELLMGRHPGLATCRGISRVAVDMEYAAEGDRVPAGSEVAIIPPVAGG